VAGQLGPGSEALERRLSAQLQGMRKELQASHTQELQRMRQELQASQAAHTLQLQASQAAHTQELQRMRQELQASHTQELQEQERRLTLKLQDMEAKMQQGECLPAISIPHESAQVVARALTNFFMLEMVFAH
jgi:hypothetical protein